MSFLTRKTSSHSLVYTVFNAITSEVTVIYKINKSKPFPYFTFSMEK